MITLLDLLPLALLGGVLGLDFVSFPQAMVSRPLVAATLAGVLVGAPAAGLTAGVSLELLALGTLPFGAARYPEWGSAAVVGGALHAAWAPAPGALPLAVLGALGAAALSSWSLGPLRRFIARRAAVRREALDAGELRAVDGLQLLGLAADGGRAAAVTGVGCALGLPAGRWLIAHWGVGALTSRAVVATVAAMVALAAVWNVVHLTRGARWMFAAGLLLGLAMLGVGA